MYFGKKNCHCISNGCAEETLRIESRVGWLWELLIISLRIKMLSYNSIVGVSDPLFFLIQLPYFYSLKPLSSQSSHPQGYYVKFSMTVQLTSARKMKFVRFFKNFFVNDLRNFFATFWLHFYVKCKVYHKN